MTALHAIDGEPEIVVWCKCGEAFAAPTEDAALAQWRLHEERAVNRAAAVLLDELVEPGRPAGFKPTFGVDGAYDAGARPRLHEESFMQGRIDDGPGD